MLWIPKPESCMRETNDQPIASRFAFMPGVEYDGFRNVTYTASDYLEVHKAFVNMVLCAEAMFTQRLEHAHKS